METNKISLKTITVCLAAMLVIETGFRLFMIGKTASALPSLGMIRCLESILLLIIVVWLQKDPAAIGLCPAKLSAGIWKGLIWSACFAVAAGVLFLILFAAGIYALDLLHRPTSSSRQYFIILFLVGGVIGPIAEEIFFRGIIYGYLRQWGAITAIILSTLIFVFTHPIGGNIPVTQFVGGIVFAIAYEKEKNLMVPITIHCLGNLAIFSLTIFF